ncbi:MAG: aldolase/citrate lyase family protein [Pseudomonadota bacterium]
MTETLRTRLLKGQPLSGTFLKTPAHDVIEVMALSGLDFVCLDAEHAPFDRARTDACLAMARALGLPALVRVPWGRPELVQSALDAGAVGVVVPHVSSAAVATDVARMARFGPHGRGFAGSTRWAGYGTGAMPDLLARSAEETVVICMIEEPEGVAAAREIAAVPGIDALFVGPADLSVAMGKTDQTSPELHAAYDAVGAACAAEGKGFATWVRDAGAARMRYQQGVRAFFMGSEHAWMLAGAKAAATDIRALQA